MVGTLEGGTEVISTEDLLASIDELNLKFKGWQNYQWWEGKIARSYKACSMCPGSILYVWDEDNPELCLCGRDADKDGYVWATVDFVCTMRR